ncbi:unnamed protein product [Mytilus coruscus]|uniref:Uncharacterized protein n=1 Tax=Mytilus coruscus TaxID=42192 RepID=A0A6J8A0W3_MYTCO|nr:unnamed protein product [Mytilus coruscus]
MTRFEEKDADSRLSTTTTVFVSVNLTRQTIPRSYEYSRIYYSVVFVGLVLGHQTDHLEMSEELPRNPSLPVETNGYTDDYLHLKSNRPFLTAGTTIKYLSAGLQPKWGGQNIGPPPEDQGRHGEMLNRVNTVVDGGHIAPQGTPSRVHGQSAFKQEAWHQGQSPGHWGGPSQMDSAYLDYSPYPGVARARPKTPGNWDRGYREQLQKKEWRHHIIGDPKQGNPPHQGVVLGTSFTGQMKTVRWTRMSRPKGHTFASQGSRKQLC